MSLKITTNEHTKKTKKIKQQKQQQTNKMFEAKQTFFENIFEMI